VVSIVVVSFNTVREVVACLESIERSVPLPHEVILVDNASADGTVAAVRARFPSVRLIANDDNVGFPKANNQALPLVRGEYVLFLNPDSELAPGTIERMVAALEGFPERAAVGPRVRKPSEFASRTCARRLPTLWTEFCDLLWLDRIFLHSRLTGWKYYEPWDRATDRDVECLLGAAMLCRTAQVRALGGFDESVPLYLDDMDLCKRLSALGRLRYLSDVPLLHQYSVSTRKQPTPLIKRLGLQATYCYFVKHRGSGYARAYVAIVAAVGLASFPLGFVRLLGGSLKKARRRWDEGRVFVDWAWRSKAVTYTLPRL
jgi:N-acetylglucosaminyl-diphospho-decaprenol L-rhamnosyltransferase